MAVRVTLHINDPVFNDQIEGYGLRRMRRLQRRIATQARVDVPVDTGHLGRMVQEGRPHVVAPRMVAGDVHDNAHYAAPVHEGRRARVIRPRNAQALRFNIGGRVVFAKVVRQGPMRGRPFLRNAGMRVAASEH